MIESTSKVYTASLLIERFRNDVNYEKRKGERQREREREREKRKEGNALGGERVICNTTVLLLLELFQRPVTLNKSERSEVGKQLLAVAVTGDRNRGKYHR